RALLDRNMGLEHPKLALLKSEVKKQLEKHPNSKILVFTQYRDTASHLVEKLREETRLSVERFVGQASKKDDPGLSQDEQAELLANFRDGDTNLLVATCIAEEGLDIPSVDMVIFYEPIPSEIRYIQRKGRTGRKTAGKAVILAANETFDIAYLRASRRRVERMRKITATLNQELNPLLRNGPRPELNPMTPEELMEAERHAARTRLEPQLIKPEEEKAREFLKEVDKATRYIWARALKAGVEGVMVEDLTEEALDEGFTPSTVKAAIDRLEDEGKLGKIGWDRVAVIESMKPQRSEEPPRQDAYDIVVEKVYPGKAVVLVNDKWRARVTAEDFEGPANLMRKDARFKARGTLYHDRGTLCFRLRKILQAA
ncbi:MAG: helicase-related protein, partial [Candidatus Bathyarchaeia archaeon]